VKLPEYYRWNTVWPGFLAYGKWGGTPIPSNVEVLMSRGGSAFSFWGRRSIALPIGMGCICLTGCILYLVRSIPALFFPAPSSAI
jgi:hypothetical protein